MTSKKNKTIIGIFVLGAIGLICAATIILGSGSLHKSTASFVLYFNSSVRGLTAGASVYFNGVRVGKVASMEISPDGDHMTFRTPVIIELDKQPLNANISKNVPNLVDYMSDPKMIRKLIRNGLRAKLTTSSFITGLLVIDLAMEANAPPVDPASLEPFGQIPQIPTIPSGIESMFTEFSKLPIKNIAAEMLTTLININKTLADMQLEKLSGNLQDVTSTLDTTLLEYSKLAAALNSNMDSLLAKTSATLNSVDSMAKNGSAILQDNSATMYQLSQTMTAIQEAALSVSYLARLLEKKPDALIFGKGN